MLTQRRSAAVTGAAIVALLVAALGGPVWLSVALGLATLAGVVGTLGARLRARGTGVLGAYAPARAMVAAAVAVCAARQGLDGATVPAAGAAALVLTGTLLEQPLGRVWRAGTRTVVNLPGVDLARPLAQRAGLGVATSVLALALAAAGVYVPAAGPVGLALVLGLAVAAVLWTTSAVRRRPTLRPTIAAALESYGAPVMVYLTGPAGTEYQLGVWLDQLAALEERVVIVVREGRLAAKVATMTTLPVVAAPTLADLEAVHVPGFRVVLYVNNGAKNGHNVRYRELTHVQLLHGESDKPSSYNPVAAMFDKIFVAGQAGIDRYASHGIDIPPEKFVIVGRPQVAGITAGSVTSPLRTVLYAPTWTGFNQDNNFGSLDPGGPAIVKALLGRGWNVVFRPHPYSLRDARSLAAIGEIEALLAADAAASGRVHRYGDEARVEMSIIDCFNASDALVSDVSSVPADYLYSAKPFVIAQVDDRTTEDFVTEFPLARAAYIARLHEPGSLDRALDGLAHDVLRETREATRVYYLGDIPRETYASAFANAVSALVAATPRAASGAVDPGVDDTHDDDPADDEAGEDD